jgi:hypothetical protein
MQAGKRTKTFSCRIAKDRLFVVEFVGVNGFVQQNQTLFVSLEVYTNSVPGIYPITTTGTSTISDPGFPARRFGSQRVLLYADPDSQIIVTAARHNGNAAARVFVDISGGARQTLVIRPMTCLLIAFGGHFSFSRNASLTPA